jgi:hypothetical protein
VYDIPRYATFASPLLLHPSSAPRSHSPSKIFELCLIFKELKSWVVSSLGSLDIKRWEKVETLKPF